MTLLDQIQTIKHWLAEQWAQQFEQRFLWVPVCVGLGIAMFFAGALPLWGGYAVTAILAALLFVVRRRGLALYALMLLAGYGAAHLRTETAIGPSLPQREDIMRIEGRIAQLDIMSADAQQLRFVLEDLVLEDIVPKDAPNRVRVTLRKAGDVAYEIGDRIAGTGSLSGVSGPVMPGGFDFSRYMAFQGIGGLGFFFRAPEVIAPSDQAQNWVAQWRYSIALKAAEHPVAVALLTGQRSGIDDADLDAMRDAGLAHMLAISGLHVGLFSGFVFFTLRLMLVMIPWVALHLPVKKIAAVCAFAAAVLYMLLAGATVPTQRAVLMVGIVFLAIVLDRSAISMRLAAFAALIVLIIAPESLLTVSFQLSFAAVIALIFVYDRLRERISEWMREAGFVRRAGLYVGGVALTSFISSVAIAPFALYHFQKLAMLGEIANVLAMPLMAFIVMPMAVLVLITMPLGLEALPLLGMSTAIDGILAVAHWVAGQDYALLRVQHFPFIAFVLCACGMLWGVLVRGTFRWIGVAGIATGILLGAQYRMPDIIIAPDHDLYAIYHEGRLYASSRSKARFIRNQWEGAYGLPDGAAQRWDRLAALRCDRAACRYEKSKVRVSFVSLPEVLVQECAWADIVISPRSVSRRICRDTQVIDHYAVRNQGAHAVYLDSTPKVLSTFYATKATGRDAQ